MRFALISVVAGLSLSPMGCSTLIPKDGPKDGLKEAKETAPQNPSNPAQPPVAPQASSGTGDMTATLNSLTARLEAMETKLAAQTEKLEAARAAIESTAMQSRKAKPVPVLAHPASRGAAPVVTDPLPGDPEAGFANDAPVQSYRKAMILYRGQKYPDAVIAFSAFLDKYPDHPLAGNAQFYVGESYFRQHEYKLAVHEFQRVLTSYDRSSHVAQTLHDMAEAEEKLKRAEDAARHRQQLSSLFPHSPYTVKKSTASRREPSPPAEAVPAQPASEAPVHPVTEPAKLDGPPPTVPISQSEAPTGQVGKE